MPRLWNTRSCLRITEPWAGERRRMGATSGSYFLTSSDPFCPDRSAAWTTSRASAARTPTAPSTPAATPAISRSAPATANRTTSDCFTATPASTASPSARGRPSSTAISPAPAGPGRRPLLPERRPDPDLTYATVHKEREKDRAVAVHRKVVLGSQEAVDQALKASACSRTINTSFVERQHATDRGRNARKARKTYKFSKDWRVHEAMTYFTLYSYNFCWAVRTLRTRRENGSWQSRTPAMAAGLSKHVWSLGEWLTFPAVQ